MTRKRRRWILLGIVLLLLAGAGTLYFYRVRLIGQFVPEVTHFKSANLRYVNDSIKGNVVMQIRNKSASQITIDKMEASLLLNDISFLHADQDVNIDLRAFEADTFSLYIGVPIQKFFKFLDDIVNQDSVALTYSLTITYNSKLGHVELPITQTINIPAPRKILSRIAKVEFVDYKDKTVNTIIYLSIYNPGRIDMQLTDLHYDFHSEGGMNASGTYPEDVFIKPGEEVMIKIPFSIVVDKPLKIIGNVIGNNDTYQYSINLGGTLQTKSQLFTGAKISLDYNGEFELYKGNSEPKVKDPPKSKKRLFKK